MLDVQSAKLFVVLVVEIQQPLAPISLEFMCSLPVFDKSILFQISCSWHGLDEEIITSKIELGGRCCRFIVLPIDGVNFLSKIFFETIVEIKIFPKIIFFGGYWRGIIALKTILCILQLHFHRWMAIIDKNLAKSSYFFRLLNCKSFCHLNLTLIRNNLF